MFTFAPGPATQTVLVFARVRRSSVGAAARADVIRYCCLQAGVTNRETNTPLIIARWLTSDVTAVLHRIPNAPLAARLEGNVQALVQAYSGIWDISTHPVPWPYTHLAQILLILWLYTGQC